jgi:hypothetical protein
MIKLNNPTPINFRRSEPGGGGAAEDPSGRLLPPPDPRIEVARRVIDLLPKLGWSGRFPNEDQVLELFGVLTTQGIHMGRNVEHIANFIARMIIGGRGAPTD